MKHSGKKILSFVVLFGLLYWGTGPISAQINHGHINEKQNIANIEFNDIDGYYSIEANINQVEKTISSDVSQNDDTLYVAIKTGFCGDCFRDSDYYVGLHVDIVNYGGNVVDGNWDIQIKNPPLNLMNGKWHDDFSLESEQSLLVKIMPKKIIHISNIPFFKLGTFDINFLRLGKIIITIQVNDIQFEASGFVIGPSIVNLHKE